MKDDITLDHDLLPDTTPIVLTDAEGRRQGGSRYLPSFQQRAVGMDIHKKIRRHQIDDDGADDDSAAGGNGIESLLDG